MGKHLDEFMLRLQGELRTGGGATLDELYNLAEAIKADLNEGETTDEKSI